MVLIGEEEQLCRYAAHTGCIEGTHALVGIDAVVLLAVDAEYRRVPLADVQVRTVGIGAPGSFRLVLVPVSIVILPVAEPRLLGIGVHALEVEGTVVCNEALETSVVDACQIIDGESAERRTDGTEPVLVHERQIAGRIVDGGEVIVHALTGPVGTYLLVPCTAVTRQAAAVGCDDDIAVGSHDLEIPPVAPELGNRTLRSAFAEEQRRVLPVRIEVRRCHHPLLHLLSVGRLHPSVVYFAQCELVVDVFVLEGELCLKACLLLLRRRDGVDFVGLGETLTDGQQLPVAQQGNADIVVVALRELLHLALETGLIDVLRRMPYADEVEDLGIGPPCVFVDVRVEALGDVGLPARGQLVDAEAVAVALITVVLHALPGDVPAVGREFGIHVVAHVHVAGLMVDGLVAHALRRIDCRFHIPLGLAEVLRPAGFHIIYIDVGIGRNGILRALFLATGIGDRLGVPAPVDLFDAAERCQRTFVRLAFEHVDTVADASVSDVSHERMGVRRHVMVPVTVVHIRDDHACSLRQITRVLPDRAVVRDALDEHDATAVGREAEALDVDVRAGELPAVRAVGFHRPQLSSGEESQGVVVEPCRIALVRCGGGEQAVVPAVGIHDAQHLVSLVLLHAVVPHLVDDPSAVR